MMKELFLDEDAAKQLASEISTNCMIEFTRDGPFITNNEYEALRDIIYNNLVTALGF